MRGIVITVMLALVILCAVLVSRCQAPPEEPPPVVTTEPPIIVNTSTQALPTLTATHAPPTETPEPTQTPEPTPTYTQVPPTPTTKPTATLAPIPTPEPIPLEPQKAESACLCTQGVICLCDLWYPTAIYIYNGYIQH